MELETAFRAAYHNVPLAPGDSYLLPAARTFVDVVAFVFLPILFQMRDTAFEVPEETAHSGRVGKVPLVFCVALCDIPREHAEVQVDDEQNDDPPQQPRGHEEVDEDEDHGERGEEAAELVDAVPAAHELYELVSESVKHEENLDL